MIDKTINSFEKAVADIVNGSTVLVGNRSEPSWPHLQSAATANLLYNHKIKVLEESLVVA